MLIKTLMSDQPLQLNITLGANTPINAVTEVNSIQITKQSGKHDEALISFRLHQFENNKTITGQFEMGGAIKIELGYNAPLLVAVFEGMITSFGIQADTAGANTYTIKAVAGNINLTHTVPNEPTLKYTFGNNLLAMDFTCGQNQETTGNIMVEGSADITIGELLQISATESFADRLWIITGLMHQVSKGNWLTKVYLS